MLKTIRKTKKEMIFNFSFLVFSFVFIVGGIMYGIGTLSAPKRGFFPFWLGIILLLLALLNTKEDISTASKSGTSAAWTFFPESDSFRKVSVTILSLIIFSAFLSTLGFPLSVALLMIMSLRFVEPIRWKSVLLVSAIVSIVCYATFTILLKVQMPVGYLGF